MILYLFISDETQRMKAPRKRNTGQATCEFFLLGRHGAVQEEQQVGQHDEEHRLQRQEEPEGLLVAVLEVVHGLRHEEHDIDPEAEEVESCR